MGNLCSSGTDRSEKKEDNQLPKTKDGADEALLSKTGEGVETTGGVDEKGQGLSGIVGGVASAGEATLNDVIENAEDQGEKAVSEGKTAAAEVVDKVKDVAGESKDALVSDVTAATTEVKESVEQKASAAVDDVNAKVESGHQNVSALVDDVRTQTTESATNVETKLQNEASQLKAEASGALQSGQEQTQSVIAGVTDKTEAVKEETVAAVETSRTEAANTVSDVKGDAVAVESAVGDTVQESSSGLTDVVKEGMQEASTKIKEVANEKCEDAHQTAEDYLNQAVDSAKASAVGSFTSAGQSAATKADEANVAASDAVTSLEESAVNVENNIAAEFASAQSGVDEIQSTVNPTQVNSALDAMAGELRKEEKHVKEEIEEIKTPEDLPPPPPSPPVPTESGSGLLGNLGSAASSAASTGVGFVGDQVVDKVQDFIGEQEKQEVIESPVQVSQQSTEQTEPPASGETQGLMGNIGSAASGVLETGVGVVSDKIVEKAQDLFGGEESTGSDQLAAEQTATPVVTSSAGNLETHTPALGDDEENKHTGDTKLEAAEEPVTQSQGQPDVTTMPPDEGDFLEKAKSLLEQHRNSVDGNKVETLEDKAMEDGIVESNNEVSNSVDDFCNNNNNVTEDTTDKVRQETARDFVEGIIDKATSIVSESMASGDTRVETGNGEGSISSSDPSVDRGEETMEPKKRGVCFASPQPSDQSFSSLSSPPEISPPPVAQDADLSPPSEASSISQGELVERDIELELPSPPQSTTEESGASPDEVSTEEPDVLDNQRIQGMEEADESLKRIAMEVTTKAVQDAIKIVTENGTGAGINNLNDLGVSSPSSGGDQEEEMTTTDSSQVERGSSVSDLTDTSQQGSIADSLSSYDPGAVFRQDMTELSDGPVGDTASAAAKGASTIVSTVDSAVTPEPESQQTATGDPSYLNNEGGSVVETPTPTNQTSFTDDCSQQKLNEQSQPSVESTATGADDIAVPHVPSPSEVPSTFPTPLHDPTTCVPTKQPTIVINSPDSAPNTNGSVEDVTASPTEALI